MKQQYPQEWPQFLRLLCRLVKDYVSAKLRFCKRNINMCSALLRKDIPMKGCRMEAVARNGCRFCGSNEDYKRTA